MKENHKKKIFFLNKKKKKITKKIFLKQKKKKKITKKFFLKQKKKKIGFKPNTIVSEYEFIIVKQKKKK